MKWFDPGRGFGFIMPDAGGEDLFAHYSAIDAPLEQQTLQENQRVAFEVAPRLKGKRSARAINIKPLD